MLHLVNWLYENSMGAVFTLEKLSRTFNIDYYIVDDEYAVLTPGLGHDPDNIIVQESNQLVLELKTWKVLAKGMKYIKMSCQDGIPVNGGQVMELPPDPPFLLLFRYKGSYRYEQFGTTDPELLNEIRYSILCPVTSILPHDLVEGEYLLFTRDVTARLVTFNVNCIHNLADIQKVNVWPREWAARWDVGKMYFIMFENVGYYVEFPEKVLDKPKKSGKIKKTKTTEE